MYGPEASTVYDYSKNICCECIYRFRIFLLQALLALICNHLINYQLLKVFSAFHFTINQTNSLSSLLRQKNHKNEGEP